MRTRRDVLKWAACAFAPAVLAGCGPFATTAMRGRLRIGIVGLPGHIADGLAKALTACFQAFARQDRVATRLEVSAYAMPPLQWYRCRPGGPCGPATTRHGSGLFHVGPSAKDPQLSGSRGGLFVRGRTALGLVYGESPPPAVAASVDALRVAGPDIIIAYSTWSYWITPIATPLIDMQKTYAEHLSGVAPSVIEHGMLLSPQEGLQPYGAPLLRDPLALFVPPALDGLNPHQAPWTWDGLARLLKRANPPVGGGGFLATASYPEGAESALSILLAQGGSLGRVARGRVIPTGDTAAARDALRLWGRLVHSGKPTWVPEGAPANGTTLAAMVSVTAQHLWSPLWLDRFQWNPTWPCWPLPAGPRGPLVPCTYLTAFINAGNASGSLAQDFVAFLWGSRAQVLLLAAGVGLPLRPQPGGRMSLLTRLYPWIGDPSAFGNADADIRISQLFHGVGGIRDAAPLYGVVDAFQRKLLRIQQPTAPATA